MAAVMLKIVKHNRRHELTGVCPASGMVLVVYCLANCTDELPLASLRCARAGQLIHKNSTWHRTFSRDENLTMSGTKTIAHHPAQSLGCFSFHACSSPATFWVALCQVAVHAC
jgi:hypothetical protein